jgi:hypothetical protein
MRGNSENGVYIDLINEIFANLHRLLQYQIGGLWAAFRWTCWILQRENHVRTGEWSAQGLRDEMNDQDPTAAYT